MRWSCVRYCYADVVPRNFLNIVNPFLANDPILYPLKTPENQRFSSVFREYKIATLAWNGLKNILFLYDRVNYIEEANFRGKVKECVFGSVSLQMNSSSFGFLQAKLSILTSKV